MGIEITGRVAVITGGARGIGRETALTFARAGARVAIWDREDAQPVVEEIAAMGGQAVASRVSVAVREDIDLALARTLDAFGRVDILINNAGITRDAQLVRVTDGVITGGMDESEFDQVIDVNLKGVFLCTQAVVPGMIQQHFGRIVSAASIVGIHGNFGQTNYVASKAGVIGMTRVWARELGRHAITANVVAPGFIETDMTTAVPEKIRTHMYEHTPVGRAGHPRDVAYAYLFLASDDAAFINGAVLSVDGGLVLGT
jgi:3-oxoacyl-[acyl-carrier protein] reductase